MSDAKPYHDALEKAAGYLVAAQNAKHDSSAAMTQARIEALQWAYGFDKDELHEAADEYRNQLRQ